MKKTMTCKQLGGPESCNQKFHAEIWEDMKQQSMNHSHEMFQKKDKSHIKAMNEMMVLMKDPKAMKEWMGNKKKEFDMLSR